MLKKLFLSIAMVSTCMWYAQAMQTYAGLVDHRGQQCAICSEVLDGAVVYGDQLFDCQHEDARYHDHCLARWIYQCAKERILISCPFCRGAFLINPDPVAPLVDAQRNEVVQALFDAVQRGSEYEVIQLLRTGIGVNATDDQGTTALDVAVSPEIEHLLIERGAPKHRVSDLFDAVTRNHVVRARSCLRHGVDVNAYDYYTGETVLDRALHNVATSQEIIALLGEYGAKTREQLERRHERRLLRKPLAIQKESQTFAMVANAHVRVALARLRGGVPKRSLAE